MREAHLGRRRRLPGGRQGHPLPCGDGACGWGTERGDANKELKRWFGLDAYQPAPACDDGALDAAPGLLDGNLVDLIEVIKKR